MRAKTLIELLSLSTSLYMLSKDDVLMEKVSEMAKKGKEKINNLYEDLSADSEEQLTEKIMHKALQAKEELEHRIGELVVKMYDKMNIAHTNEIKNLETKLADMQKDLALAEARIVNLESTQ
jgi:hypothetical protein